MPGKPWAAKDILAVADQLDLSAIADLITQPPAWTRLEPQSMSGAPDAWIEARVHDPLWLLGRQWQGGEFRGEDCGAPVSIGLRATVLPLSGLRPGRAGQGQPWVPLDRSAAIEPWIEREPWSLPSLRDRTEAGAALAQALRQAGGDPAPLRIACPVPPEDLGTPGADPGWLLIARTQPDAEAAALAIEGGAPAWLDGAPPAAREAAAAWLAWYRRNVSPRHDATESWQPSRLEYAFELQAGPAEAGLRLRAERHDGGALDWHVLDRVEPDGAALPAAEATLRTETARVHASRLRYAGMPASRYWQFEDGRVNLGMLDAQPGDLLRLCFTEFATVTGPDWLLAPLDLPRGSYVRLDAVTIRTGFGEDIPLGLAQPGGGFALFATSTGTAGAAEPGFLLPPGGRSPQEGPALEEVVFARDEAANLAWAIELTVEGPEGLPRDRPSEAPPPAPVLSPAPGTDLLYRLERTVPPWWVPLVPVPTRRPDDTLTGGFVLQKGRFADEAGDRARGRLLAGEEVRVFDEEIPREGLRLRRVPCVMRDESGALLRWIARRVGPGTGEAASRLAYDSTFRSGPP